MIKSNSKKVFTVLLLLNMAVLVAIGILATLIRGNYVSALQFRQESVDELAKISDVVSLKQVVSETDEERQYINSLFVDKDQVIDFLEFLESLGELSGADVNVISVDEGSPEAPTEYTTINFEIIGTWAQVFKTVSLIDHLTAALSVSRIQINKNYVSTSGKTQELLWSAIVEARVLKLHF
ncbi:MAG TPA: hypothetical protein VJI33_02570 [Candidatus Paceibacterota bacterium]